MSHEWSLDTIYTGFDDPRFEEDLAALKETIGAFSALTDTLPAEDAPAALKAGICLQEEIQTLTDKLGLYASLRQAADSRDTDALSQMGRLMGICSMSAAPEAAFQEWTASLPQPETLAAEDAVLGEYRFLLKKLKDSSRYLLGSRGEEIMAKMQMSGGNAWADLHTHLTSTVPVSYRGTTTTLSAIRNLAFDPDPKVRKDAYEAEIACYAQIREPVAFALNSIKLETLSDCQLRGYDSPLERTLIQSDMSRATLDAMLGAIEESLGSFHRYLRAKAAALGCPNALPWYDMAAPMGTATGAFTPESARDYLADCFRSFDEELAGLVERAFDEQWIDFWPRQGKSGGAFCAEVHCLQESRILTNFDGLYTDVVTLAHELGHAFHNQCIFSHRPLNRSYSMPVAETASTFNECLVNAGAIAAAKTNGEKLAILDSLLHDATQIICDIYSRFLFEAAVFRHREDRFMDADTLCGLMTDAQKQAYGDGLDHSCLHPYMWICKSHYYGPTFYNFPYAFGGLFARGLYAQYLQEGPAFAAKYKKLLHATPVATAEDCAKAAGIDLTDRQFWRSALQTVADQIDQFCELLEES